MAQVEAGERSVLVVEPTDRFQGFPPNASGFFVELAANNSAEWFHAHKADYEGNLRGPMSDLVTDLGAALARRGVPLVGDPKRAIFRINRDVRFSKDKRPYKTNVSAVLSRDGNKRSQGLLYVQVGLDENFAALGFYALEPALLSAMRDRIVAERDAWRGVMESLAGSGLTLKRDDTLSRLPRGYDAADVGDLADTLKLKSFIVSIPLDEGSLQRPSLVERLTDFGASGMPLLAFGWKALT